MRVLKLGAIYCGIVFAAGLVLGTIRTLLLLPVLGERTAELLEAPVMLAVIAYTASRLVDAARPALAPRAWLIAGIVALCLLLAIELTVVLKLRQLTLAAYIAGRDTVAGLVYLVSLVVFVLAPWLRARLSLR